MKAKIFLLLFFLTLVLACGPKLNSDSAASAVKSAFNLTEKDMVEILGISKESKDIMLVKFKIDGTEINSKMRKYDKGWQLDEVQNMLGGWIPATNIKSQIDPTEKVKIAMIDINIISTGLADYITDHGKYAFPETSLITESSEIYQALCPYYIKSLPTNDPWGRPYNVIHGKSINGSLYGITSEYDDDFLVFTFGRDRKMEEWTYDSHNDKAGLTEDINPDNDIINYSGTYIRSPKSLVRQIY